MNFILICLIFYALVSISPRGDYMLFYETDFKSGDKSLSQYILVQGNSMTSVEFTVGHPEKVSVYEFSEAERKVWMKTILHSKKTYFVHQVSYDSIITYSIEDLDERGKKGVLIDKNKCISINVDFSDTLANVHPRTMMNTHIPYLPIRLEYPDKVSELKKVYTDSDVINRILDYSATKGYALLDIMDLKIQSYEKTGYTFEELEENLRQKRP